MRGWEPATICNGPDPWNWGWACSKQRALLWRGGMRSGHPGITQAGRDLWRSVVQPLATARPRLLRLSSSGVLQALRVGVGWLQQVPLCLAQESRSHLAAGPARPRRVSAGGSSSAPRSAAPGPAALGAGSHGPLLCLPTHPFLPNEEMVTLPHGWV